MKACPKCERLFVDDLDYCGYDGARLIARLNPPSAECGGEIPTSFTISRFKSSDLVAGGPIVAGYARPSAPVIKFSAMTGEGWGIGGAELVKEHANTSALGPWFELPPGACHWESGTAISGQTEDCKHAWCSLCSASHEYIAFGGTKVLSCPQAPNDGNLHGFSFETAPRDIAQGDPIAFVESGREMQPRGLDYAGDDLPSGPNPGIQNPDMAFSTEGWLWTCTNHAPGLEVKDIPAGEKCSACGCSR